MANDLNIVFNSDPDMALSFTASHEFTIEFAETAIGTGGAGASIADVLATILAGTNITIDRQVANRITISSGGGGTPVTPATYSGFFGWSADRVIETSDFAAADDSSSRVGTLAANISLMYAWFAVPETQGYPVGLTVQIGSGTPSGNQIRAFERLTDTVNDSLGVAHIVGVSRRRWAINTEQREITLDY